MVLFTPAFFSRSKCPCQLFIISRLFFLATSYTHFKLHNPMVQLLKLQRGVASKLEMWKAIGPFAALPLVCLCKDLSMSGQHCQMSRSVQLEAVYLEALLYIRGFTKFGFKVLWRLQFLEYLRTLSLKSQKAKSKIEVFLSLPCWLSQSKPSEILILRSPNTPETVAFTIP